MDKKQQIIDLWRQSFNDSEEFIQFYFDRKYKDKDSLIYEKNGKALSAFLMLPYPMTWAGMILETSYISGACTLKEARNQGLMTSLLQKAFLEMNKRKIAVSTLIPAENWLYNYYSKLGYATVFDYSLISTQLSQPLIPTEIYVNSPEKYDPEFTDQLFSYFDRHQKTRSCCIQHPREDYHSIVEENYLAGGRLAATYSTHTHQPGGWALAFAEKGFVKVKEIFYDSPKDKKALFQTFAQIWNLRNIQYKVLPQNTNLRRYGMARITDAFQMLQHFANTHPDLSFSLKLNDPLLPSNQGIYILSKGHCEKKESSNLPTDIITDIPDLTKALLGYYTEQLPQNLIFLSAAGQPPYMNLMLD